MTVLHVEEGSAGLITLQVSEAKRDVMAALWTTTQGRHGCASDMPAGRATAACQ